MSAVRVEEWELLEEIERQCGQTEDMESTINAIFLSLVEWLGRDKALELVLRQANQKS